MTNLEEAFNHYSATILMYIYITVVLHMCIRKGSWQFTILLVQSRCHLNCCLRELAYQIADQFRVFSRSMSYKDCVIVGGVGKL